MPILFSSTNASIMSEKVLWIDEYVSRADSGLLTPSSQSFGLKTYIPSGAKAVLRLNPTEYLAAFGAQFPKPELSELPPTPSTCRATANRQAEFLIRKALGMADPVITEPPAIPITSTNPPPTLTNHPTTTRKSATLHKTLMSKLRPPPFQYIWAIHYEKPIPPPNSTTSISKTSIITTSGYPDRITTLTPSIPNIRDFYKSFNNIPWPAIPTGHSVHIFRADVCPIREEEAENRHGGGGCFTIKVARRPQQPPQQQQQQQQQGPHTTDAVLTTNDRPQRLWEEICLLSCGGELQAALVEAGSRDHVLGMTYSPRLDWVCVSVWLKGCEGDGEGGGKGLEVVKRHLRERLSDAVRPREGEDEWGIKEAL